MKSMKLKAPWILAITLLTSSVTTFAAGIDTSGGGYPGYMELDPPLIVNLSASSRSKYLRADIQLYVETAEEADLITEHMPRIRDRLISLTAGRDGSSLMTAQARDELRSELLADLRKTMADHTGRAAISELYFTGFIIQ